jgi:ubiquinone/menaquinone biosynthesis C-methylase UbiE
MDFDSKARAWDKDPVKIERAKKFAERIISSLPENNSIIAMEFGSGTGQVSLFLHKQFRHIYLIDSSPGMIDVLKNNIRQRNIQNMEPLLKDVMKESIDLSDIDVIYTLMTLHHIEDLNHILNVFRSILKPGGFLLIGDLEKEDGSFHDHAHDFRGHHGFEKDELKKLLEKNGFNETDYRKFFKLTKKFENGGLKEFPLFFMAARKK